jgi:dipeptidyl aminopeptidase/acylaminoacyl peptidase
MSAHRGVVAAAILVLALGAQAAPAIATGGGAGNGVPGAIVYSSDQGSGTMLWTVTPGASPMPIPGTQRARSARWSPDGRVIAFSRSWGDDEGIFLVNPDGSGLRKLFPVQEGEHFGDPLWSPDGSKVLFGVLSPGDGFSHVEIADSLDGIRQVVDTELSQVNDWLPDGRIVGAIVRNWQDEATGEYRHSEELALVDLDGTVHELTATDVVMEGVPRVSPDGTKVAFVESVWQPTFQGYKLSVMNIDGSGRRVLRNLDHLSWPTWSPDGRKILYGRVLTTITLGGTVEQIGDTCCNEEGSDWAALPGTVVAPAAMTTAAWTGIRALALPDPSTKQTAWLGAGSIWPSRDGYRDTLRITQRFAEPGKSRIDIFNSSGTLVRRAYLPYRTGGLNYTWNGRTRSGSILPAGRYRIVTVAFDLAGNVLHRTLYVRLYRGSP